MAQLFSGEKVKFMIPGMLTFALGTATTSLMNLSDVVQKQLQQTRPFEFNGWAWAVIFFALYPIRHFITRMFEGVSLSLEHWLIEHGVMDSVQIHRFIIGSYGQTQTEFSISGNFTLINLLTTGNYMDSIKLEINKVVHAFRWEPFNNHPSSMSAREAQMFKFSASNIVFKDEDSVFDFKLVAKDMFGRSYIRNLQIKVQGRLNSRGSMPKIEFPQPDSN